MFGDVVMGVDHDKYEEILSDVKKQVGVNLDTDLTAEDLKVVISRYKELYKKVTGEDFPPEPFDQLKKSINAVFSSWNNKKLSPTERSIKFLKSGEPQSTLNDGFAIWEAGNWRWFYSQSQPV